MRSSVLLYIITVIVCLNTKHTSDNASVSSCQIWKIPTSIENYTRENAHVHIPPTNGLAIILMVPAHNVARRVKAP